MCFDAVEESVESVRSERPARGQREGVPRHNAGGSMYCPDGSSQCGLPEHRNSAESAESVDTMALGIYFAHEGFTPEKYATAIQELNEAGEGNPKGRTYHFALEQDGSVHVFDVWESQEDFDAFGPVLIPVLTSLDVSLQEPMVMTVHNIITQ